MDIQFTAQTTANSTLLENYLSYWTQGEKKDTQSGLIADLTHNITDKLEPELAQEYKEFIINFYNKLDSERSDNAAGKQLTQLSDIIAQKSSGRS